MAEGERETKQRVWVQSVAEPSSCFAYEDGAVMRKKPTHTCAPSTLGLPLAPTCAVQVMWYPGCHTGFPRTLPLPLAPLAGAGRDAWLNSAPSAARVPGEGGTGKGGRGE